MSINISLTIKTTISILSTRSVVVKCLKCLAFQAGKCIKIIINKYHIATEAIPPTRKNKKEGDILSIFILFSGQKAKPLPKRYQDLKQQLTTRFKEQI
jgi:hypothetical protein